MKKKYYIETQGCQMNEYDSNKMKDLLSKEMDFIDTDTKEDADILIVNTCSIREKAQEKVFSLLGKWRKLKIKNPDLVIGVAGCVAFSRKLMKFHLERLMLIWLLGHKQFIDFRRFIKSL
jgi:tRNA-2-methylthio-N6-dimethylallyladenosine synthase